MDSMYYLLISFLVFLIIGVPISFCLLASSIVYIFFSGNFEVFINIVPIKLFRSTDSFIFIAVPLFILMGKLMNASGLTMDLINVADLFVGRLKGGLAHVNVVVSMLFGGCSGTAISDTSAIGTVLIPEMVDRGYEKDFSAAVTAASSTMGPIIPPSMAFILYGASSGLSISTLFIAGVIPGILVGLFQMVVVSIYAYKRNYPKRENIIPIREALRIMKRGLWGLLLPIIILGGIIFGIFTPTEAAVIAVVYSLFVSIIVYKERNIKKYLNILIEAGVEAGSIMIIIATTSLFGWVLANEQIPIKFAQMVTSFVGAPWQALILINIFLLIIGMFMDNGPAIILLVPIVVPLFKALGIDPIQGALITCVNLTTGLSTPPVGCCLFAASSIAKESFTKISKAIVPFLLANIVVVILITYFPVFTLWLPKILGK